MRLAKTLAGLAAAIALSACWSWRTDARPVTSIVGGGTDQVRLTSRDGSSIVLSRPRLIVDSTRAEGTSATVTGASDTLVAGRLLARRLANGAAGRGTGQRGTEQVVVRASEVTKTEIKHRDRVRTWLAVAAGVLFASYAISLGKDGRG